MKCEKCKYEWKPKKTQPKCCPQCKTRLNLPPARLVFNEEDLRQVLKEGAANCIDLRTGTEYTVIRRVV